MTMLIEKPEERVTGQKERQLSPEQILFEVTQLVCIKQIRDHARYDAVACVKGGKLISKQFEVVTGPQRRDDGGWWIEIRYTRPENGDVDTVYSLSLQDQSIFPYEDGRWNKFNYIRIPEEFGGKVLNKPGTDCPCSKYHV